MESKQIVIALAALAQDTRLAIYRLLVEAGPTGESAGEIASAVKAAPATLSFHLKELAHAGLIVPRQDGRYIFYAANFARMTELVTFLTANCCVRDGVTCGVVAKARAAKPAGQRRARAARPITARRAKKRSAAALA